MLQDNTRANVMLKAYPYFLGVLRKLLGINCGSNRHGKLIAESRLLALNAYPEP